MGTKHLVLISGVEPAVQYQQRYEHIFEQGKTQRDKYLHGCRLGAVWNHVNGHYTSLAIIVDAKSLETKAEISCWNLSASFLAIYIVAI